MAKVIKIQSLGTNRTFCLKTPLATQFKVDQSVAHNGVCLTVEKIEQDTFQVTAVDETLKKSNLGQWKVGDFINLERSLSLNKLLDGHLVQGHVDEVGTLESVTDKDGSYMLKIGIKNQNSYPIINKGSITINGISLTVVEASANYFTVTIIPYTWQHTNLKYLQVGNSVNLEYDVLGKYVQKLVSNT